MRRGLEAERDDSGLGSGPQKDSGAGKGLYLSGSSEQLASAEPLNYALLSIHRACKSHSASLSARHTSGFLWMLSLYLPLSTLGCLIPLETKLFEELFQKKPGKEYGKDKRTGEEAEQSHGPHKCPFSD